MESISKENNIKEQRDSRWLEAIALINIGDCKMNLWEIEEAIKYYKLAIHKNVNEYVEETCDYRLAFAYLCVNQKEMAIYFADKSYQDIPKGNLTRSNIGYRAILLVFVYRGIQSLDKALEMYREALSFSEESHHPRFKAMTLLGMAEIYRDNQDFESAIADQLKAVKLLEKVEIKCDLAEAYYQLGLTYQAMEETEKSDKNFQEAIQLFSEMEAPKQVERVRRSMQN